MAFDYKNLTPVGAQASIAPGVWSYTTTDSIDDVLSAGYFADSVPLEEGDLIVAYVDGAPYQMRIGADKSTATLRDGEAYDGFMDYNDTSTSTTPINLLANTWTDIPNDGLGAFTNKTFAPAGVDELMDTGTGYIDPTGLPLGATIFIRNDYTIIPTTNNAKQEFRYSLGTGGNAYTLEKTLGRLDSGAGNPYRSSLETDLIYMGDTNTRDNPIKLQVKMSTDATLTNAGSVIVVK